LFDGRKNYMKRKKLLTIAMVGAIACMAMTGCGSKADTSVDTVETVSETVSDVSEEVETQTESETSTDVETTTEEEIILPYAEQEELKFSDLSSFEIPFLSYFTDEESEADNGLEIIQGNATYTLGDITVSEPDEDGNVIYTFPYTLDMENVIKGDLSKGFSYGFSYQLFGLIDYYTGIHFPSKDLNNDESFEYYTDIEWDGVTYSVGYSSGQEVDYGNWNVEGNTAIQPVIVNATITIKAPADYDGAVLFINRNELTEIPDDDDEVSEAEPFEVEEGSTIEDYTFIRLTDYVTQ
jgi:hypothetical protein